MAIIIILSVLFVLYVFFKLSRIKKTTDSITKIIMESRVDNNKNFEALRTKLDDHKWDIVRNVDQIVKEKK